MQPDVNQQQQRKEAQEVQIIGASEAATVSSDAPTSRRSADDVQLFVSVITLAANKDKRDAIRITWGADPRSPSALFAGVRLQPVSVYTPPCLIFSLTCC